MVNSNDKHRVLKLMTHRISLAVLGRNGSEHVGQGNKRTEAEDGAAGRIDCRKPAIRMMTEEKPTKIVHGI